MVKQHLTNDYPNVFKCSKVSHEICQAIRENLESLCTQKKHVFKEL